MADVMQLIRGGFFDSINQDRLYSASDMTMPYKRIVSDGVFPDKNGSASQDFIVSYVEGMLVSVAPGNALLGGRWAESLEALDITVAGNSSAYDRIDSIILRADASRNVRAIGIVYRQGEAAASPTAPALESTADVVELRIANIYIPSGAASLSSASISDQRGAEDCPWVAGVIPPTQAQIGEAVDEYLDEHPGIFVVDDEFSDSSTNAVQNRVVAAAVGQLTEDVADVNGRLDGLGDGVPTEVRQAILALFNSAAYAETGLTDEIAVIASWAAVVTAIALNNTSISISGANTSQLVATTTPTGGAVSWASSDTSVATVSNNGLVTGVGNGTATITAYCGGKTATCSVTVSGFASLTGITATYTQSGTVYDTDTLDSLKSDLVVVATYSDSSTQTVTNYTLSGTLTVGTSTITVSYGGKTTTFNVTVTDPSAIQITYTQGSIGAGNTDTNRVSGVITSGVHFDDGETLVITPASGYSIYPFGFYTNTNEELAGTRYGTNVLYAYVISDSGYVTSQNSDIGGTLKVGNTNMSNQSNAGWKTGSVTYSFTKTGQYGYTFTGLGFLVKKDDNSDITPSDIEPLITINKEA